MARRNIFANITSDDSNKPAPNYVATGASRSMKASLGELAGKAALVDQGAVIVELDPLFVDPSPFPDRLPDDDPQVFDELKRSISEEGQKVPVQVRPHPGASDRYQVIYGHRRLKAANELGVKIKAIIQEASDAELVVAQGIENAARQDLSWIEKALFAMRMEDERVKPRDIKAALTINDQELARMRSVYKAVPTDVINAIGRAPKVGRPRWMELAGFLENKVGTVELVRKTLPAGKVLDSNQRFQAALDALKVGANTPVVAWNRKIEGLATVRVIADTTRGEAFAKFIEAELPALVERFEQGES